MSNESVPVELMAEGEILELTESGTPVTNGQIVLRIDSSRLAENIEEFEANIQTYEAERDVDRASWG